MFTQIYKRFASPMHGICFFMRIYKRFTSPMLGFVSLCESTNVSHLRCGICFFVLHLQTFRISDAGFDYLRNTTNVSHLRCAGFVSLCYIYKRFASSMWDLLCVWIQSLIFLFISKFPWKSIRGLPLGCPNLPLRTPFSYKSSRLFRDDLYSC